MVTGDLVGGRYRLGDRIGQGGRSVVYRGWDERLGRPVAVKALRADLAGDPSHQIRFRRAARSAATLNHPAIVAVYNSGETAAQSGPVPYTVVEYIDGQTLRELLGREGRVPPRRAMEIVADVCAALDFAHRHGIVHRDVRPATIMVTRASAVKVMDFGGARTGTDDQPAPTPVAPGSPVPVHATAQYLSPEQVRGDSVDARSDVYATGCVLYELLTGAPPFTGDSPVANAHLQVREAPQPPSQAQPWVGREIDAIVLTALSKNPLNRYQSSAQMRSDLLRALSGQAVQAAQPSHHGGERTELISPATLAMGPRPWLGVAGSPALLAPMPADVGRDRESKDRVGRHRGGVSVGVGAVSLALAAAIWLTLRVVTAPPPAPLVAVPDLSGMPLSQATAVLQADLLTLGAVTPIASSPSDQDRVVDQRPSGQTDVTRDTAVSVDIGTGVPPVT